MHPLPEPAAARPSARDLSWLVLRAQTGDRDALERLLREAAALLAPYLQAMLRNPDVRHDVLQDVLVILYRRLGALREPRAFTAWARRIASREIFRALRRQRRQERLYDELPDELPAPDDDPGPVPDELLPDELPYDLGALLERVSPASRAVLALHYGEGLTLEEIAAVLDLPTGTAKSRLGYGLATLRRQLAAARPPGRAAGSA